jgi:hypothetical protein
MRLKRGKTRFNLPFQKRQGVVKAIEVQKGGAKKRTGSKA